MAQLTVNKVRSIGELLLQDHPITIGRSSQNVVVLPDNLVSRQHCIIQSEGGHTKLRDSGSRFGTRVNGEAVSEVVLHDGDVITIGPYEIAFVDPRAPERTSELEILDAEELELDDSDIDLSLAVDNEREELERQRRELESMRNQLAAQNAALQEDRAALEAERVELGAAPPADALDKLQRELSEARDAADVEQRRAAELEAQLAEREQTTAAETQAADDAKQTLQQRVQELEARLAAEQDTNGQVEALQNEIDAARREADTAREQAAGLEQRVAELGAMAAAGAAIEAERAEIAAARAQIEAERSEVTAAREPIEAERAEIAAARAQIEAERSEVAAARAQIEAERSEVAAAREPIEAERAEIAAARAQIEAERSEVTAAREPIEAERAEIAAARAQIEAERSEVTAAREPIEAERAEIAAARAQIEAERSEVTAAREPIEAERAEIAAARAQIEAERSEVTAAREPIEAERAEIAAARAQIEAERSEVTAARGPLEAERAEIAAALEQIAAERTEITSAREKLETGSGNAEQLKSELDRALSDAVVERNRVVELEQRADDLSRSQAALESERTELRARLEQAEEERLRRSTETEQRAAELENRETALADQSRLLAEDRSTIDQQTADLTAARAALDRREQDLADQSEDLARSLQSLSEAAQAPEDIESPIAASEPSEPPLDVEIPAEQLEQQRRVVDEERTRVLALRNDWERSKQDFVERSENTRRDLVERLEEAESELEFLRDEAYEPVSVDLDEEAHAPAPARRTAMATIDPLRVLRRHAAGIIAAGVIGGLLGYAGFLLASEYGPRYSGAVTFELQAPLEGSSSLNATSIAQPAVIGRLASTETTLIAGREVLRSALEGIEVRQTNWYQQFQLPDGTFAIDDAIDDLQDSLSPRQVRGSNLFDLSWTAQVADDVPIVLNAIARTYLNGREMQDDSIYNANADVFRAHVHQTDRDLENLGQEVRNFIRDRGLTTLDDLQYSSTGIASENYARSGAAMIDTYDRTNTMYEQIMAKLEGEADPTPSDMLAAENDPQAQRQIRLVLALKTEYRRVRDRYAPDHAIVRRVEQQLRAAEIERDTKLDEIITLNLQAAAKTLRDQIEQFDSVMARTSVEAQRSEEELHVLAGDRSELGAMMDRHSYLQIRRETILQLLKEVEVMRMRSDGERVRIAEWAAMPREMSFPRIGTMIPLGVILTMGMVVGIVFLREFVDQRVKSASDIGVIPGANVLGVIPDLDDDPTNVEACEMVVRRHPGSIITESLRQAATPIFADMEDLAAKVLMVTGGLPGAGTTSVVTNLAALAATTGKRVLVVDANFRRPRLPAALGIESDGPGFGDLIADETMLDETIIDAGDGIHLIHAGTPANRVSDRLHEPIVDQIVLELRDRYDVVIFDTAPAVAATDAIAIGDRAEAAILVVRANQEHRGLVARLVRDLDDSPAELLGIILNRPRRTAGGYFKKNYSAMASYAVEQSA